MKSMVEANIVALQDSMKHDVGVVRVLSQT
jgi:hypothetical protein